MVCKYNIINVSEIPVGRKIRYFCRESGKIKTSVFRSFYYDAATAVIVVIDDGAEKKINVESDIFICKDKGRYDEAAVNSMLLQGEIHTLRGEIVMLKEKMSLIAKALKLLSNKSNQH